MTSLLSEIRQAVAEDRYLVTWHADERLEERQISGWQVVEGLDTAELVDERPRSHPNPSIVVRQLLADGTEVEAVWSYSRESQRAKLVTVYFLDVP